MGKTFVLAAAAAALLLAGCATPPPPLPRGVSLIDAERLGPMLQVQEPAVARTRSGTMQVSVPVRNISPGRLVLEGRATFRGGAAEAPSGWRRVFINKDSAETLEFSSLGTQANDFQVELREGNR